MGKKRLFLTQYNETEIKNPAPITGGRIIRHLSYWGGKVWQVRQCYRQGIGKTIQLFNL